MVTFTGIGKVRMCFQGKVTGIGKVRMCFHGKVTGIGKDYSYNVFTW